MTPTPPSDDVHSDAHLLAALRHAPDHDLAPPANVSRAILDHARQAARQATRPTSSWQPRLRDAFDALWRPAPLAAFGTLAMATLIGVIWGGHELPEPTPGLPPPAARAPAGAQPPAEDPAAARRADPQAGTDIVAAQRKPPAPFPAAPGLRRDVSAPPAAPVPRVEGVDERAAEKQRPQAKSTAERAALPAVGRAVDAAGDAPLPAPSSMATPVPVPAPQVQSRAAIAPQTAAREAATLEERGGRASAVDPLAGAAALIESMPATDAARLRWRVAPQRLLPHTAVQQQWWTRVRQDSQGRWQPADAARGGATAPLVELLVDDVVQGSIAFDADALVWRDGRGAAWRAELPDAQLARLREAISSW